MNVQNWFDIHINPTTALLLVYSKQINSIEWKSILLKYQSVWAQSLLATANNDDINSNSNDNDKIYIDDNTFDSYDNDDNWNDNDGYYPNDYTDNNDMMYIMILVLPSFEGIIILIWNYSYLIHLWLFIFLFWITCFTII